MIRPRRLILSLRAWEYIALLLAVAVSADSVSGQESEAATDQHGDVEHAFPNEALIFIGSTAKGGENSFTAGLEYERRLGGRFGAGLFLDWAANHHEREFIVGATAVYRPGLGGLKLLAGPALELEEHEPSKSTVEENGSGAVSSQWLFLLRLGAHYGIEFGQFVLVPQINWDATEANDAFVIGLGAGVAF